MKTIEEIRAHLKARILTPTVTFQNLAAAISIIDEQAAEIERLNGERIKFGEAWVDRLSKNIAYGRKLYAQTYPDEDLSEFDSQAQLVISAMRRGELPPEEVEP